MSNPLLLNLGSGRYPLAHCVNLDADNWCAETGLPFVASRSVDGMTISHMLMYLTRPQIRTLLSECRRVLKQDGVLRVTEDDTTNPAAARQGLQPGAVFETGLVALRDLLVESGFRPVVVSENTTVFSDDSLRQANHGDVPDVFFIEGWKS
jgi:hypothetical protein